jgi:hypothetical protein
MEWFLQHHPGENVHDPYDGHARGHDSHWLNDGENEYVFCFLRDFLHLLSYRQVQMQ